MLFEHSLIQRRDASQSEAQTTTKLANECADREDARWTNARCVLAANMFRERNAHKPVRQAADSRLCDICRICEFGMALVVTT